MLRVIQLLVVAVCVFGNALSASATVGWTVTSLHPAGRPLTAWSVARGVSNGQQVGYTTGPKHASLWSGSADSWVDLDPNGTNESTSAAYGVYGGQRVGEVDSQASLWNGTAASWVKLGEWGSRANATSGINQVGRIGEHATMWSGTSASMVDLHPGGSWSEAYGVSGNQQVGEVFTGGYSHASLWTGSAASWVDLNPAGSTESIALCVSDGRQAGRASVGLVSHAGLWSGTAASWVDLHPLVAYDSRIHGISGNYQAGVVRINQKSIASLWNGTASSWVNLHQLLPTGVYSQSTARAIYTDSTGIWVVGEAKTTIGQQGYEAILWHYTPVPEPSGILALCGGVAGLLAFRRRR